MPPSAASCTDRYERRCGCSGGGAVRTPATCPATSTCRALATVRSSSAARSPGAPPTPVRRTSTEGAYSPGVNRRRSGSRRSRGAVLAGVLAVALLLAACGSGTKTVAPTPKGATGTSPNAPISKTLGTGVTAKTIRIGIALVDFKCIEPYVQFTRRNEDKVYRAFIDDI